MDLYLVRHGEAYTSQERFERPLNERGQEEVEIIAKYLLSKNINVQHIFHSEKVRAIETAEIIAKTLGMVNQLTLMPSLSPEEDLYRLIGDIHEIKEPTLIVGHLPNLALLTSFLLTGDIHNPSVSFATATCALFEQQNNVWTLKWSMDPATLKNSA